MAILVIAACDDHDIVTGAQQDELVQVAACVEDEAGAETRAAISGEAYTGSPSTNPLTAAVWFSTTSGNYATNDAQHRNTVTFTTDLLTFPQTDISYPANNNTIYAVGLYPSTGWTTSNNTTAKHAIDGVSDIMMAPQVSASSASKFASDGSANTLSFKHHLTWLKICVREGEDGAAASWGNVKKIYVKTPHNQLELNLATGAVVTPASPTEEEITVYEDATGHTLSNKAVELGSVFCHPAASYYVKVDTDTDLSTGWLTVDLTDLNRVALTSSDIDSKIKGKQFVLTLSFYTRKVIDATATLNGWDTSSDTIYGS